jgi:mannose-1-phosphate guanylyltransferase
MHAVIMAGGKGTRFWPKSREKKPKHLLDIISTRTIVQETVDRIKSLIPTENILIVTGKSHAEELASQLPEIPRKNIIVEPIGRNTAPCIGLAALHIKRKNIDDVMIVLPADHLILDVSQFINILAAAAQKAKQGPYLITIGITPSSPETGYGYLEQGNLIDNINGKIIYKVKSIREKPPLAQAKEFLRLGNFLWNSGMFIWKTSSILNEIQQWLPQLYDGLLAIEKAMETDQRVFIIDKIYQNLQPISIDYGVMEKTRHSLLMRGDFGWSDIGSWDALWEISEKDENGNAVKGHFIGLNARKSLIHGSQKLIALVDVEDLIIVETHDSILICKRGASQKVKNIVEMLEAQKSKEYL